jgi:hypothetical protein
VRDGPANHHTRLARIDNAEPVERVLTERYAVLGERIEGDLVWRLDEDAILDVVNTRTIFSVMRSKLSLGEYCRAVAGKVPPIAQAGKHAVVRNLIALKGLREEPQPFVSIRSFRMGKGMGEKAWQVKIHCVATTCSSFERTLPPPAQSRRTGNQLFSGQIAELKNSIFYASCAANLWTAAAHDLRCQHFTEALSANLWTARIPEFCPILRIRNTIPAGDSAETPNHALIYFAILVT